MGAMTPQATIRFEDNRHERITRGAAAAGQACALPQPGPAVFQVVRGRAE